MRTRTNMQQLCLDPISVNRFLLLLLLMLLPMFRLPIYQSIRGLLLAESNVRSSSVICLNTFRFHPVFFAAAGWQSGRVVDHNIEGPGSNTKLSDGICKYLSCLGLSYIYYAIDCCLDLY